MQTIHSKMKYYNLMVTCIGLFLSIIRLSATNDSLKNNKIGISIGRNFTAIHVKSKYPLNSDLTYIPQYSLFVEGHFIKKVSKKGAIETQLIFEQRNTFDKKYFVATDIYGNTVGSQTIKQINYCLSLAPMLFCNMNKFLSVGIGPSLNYVVSSMYRLSDFEGHNYHPNYYYKKFQPEINAGVKITIKHVTLSLGYSMSLMDKVKGSGNNLKEYDRVIRYGIGYLFNKNKRNNKISTAI
jgi:hypothetical protein